MSLRTARRYSWILALLPAFGCSKDLRDVLTEHKAAVEPQLAKFAAIRTAAKAAPRVTVDGVTINGPAPKIGVFDVDEHANVAIEYLEDLEDPIALGNIPYRIAGSGSMNRCAALLANRRAPYNPILGTVPDEVPWYSADNHLKHCEVVRYVFVIRSIEYSGPSVTRNSFGGCPKPSSDETRDAGAPPPADAGASAAKPCKVFDGGYLSAEVLVFDMKNASHLGGFRFVAESSPTIDVGTASDNSATLANDFANKIRFAFTTAAHKWVPSFTVGN
ncbi:MAG: hypothetical protein IPM54_06655 [Polyangiaceae bacterium]|nr:hypothetical protein [Polyangiaceae bacterium]